MSSPKANAGSDQPRTPRSAASAPDASAEEASRPGQVPKKGRPTPKAAERAQEHKRPLGGESARKRRTMNKSEREAERQRREQMYQAMKRGEERALPARDRGPVRRYIRDYVDARWNLGEWFLPIALLFVVLTFVTASNQVLAFYVLILLYILVLFTLVDAVITWRQVKKRIIAKFGAESITKGSAMYCIMRIYQLRRTRVPSPQVRRGEYPA